MRPISMDVDIEYLLGFLQDELRNLEDVRIVPVAPSGVSRSVDLPQDYDPNMSDVHSSRGVRVRVGSREFFFPAIWVRDHLDWVRAQAEQIRGLYE